MLDRERLSTGDSIQQPKGQRNKRMTSFKMLYMLTIFIFEDGWEALLPRASKSAKPRSGSSMAFGVGFVCVCVLQQ